MKRRELLAGAAGLGVVGAGAAMARSDAVPLGSEEGVEPVSVETLAAPGSEAGTTAVPERGSVTFLEFFATWCSICKDMMGPLGEVHESVDDSVQFVSVTNEPIGQTITRDDVVEWWQEHDGRWPVGLDSEYELTATFDVTGVPTAFVLDADNVITWSGEGRKSPETLVEQIEAAGD